MCAPHRVLVAGPSYISAGGNLQEQRRVVTRFNPRFLVQEVRGIGNMAVAVYAGNRNLNSKYRLESRSPTSVKTSTSRGSRTAVFLRTWLRYTTASNRQTVVRSTRFGGALFSCHASKLNKSGDRENSDVYCERHKEQLYHESSVYTDMESEDVRTFRTTNGWLQQDSNLATSLFEFKFQPPISSFLPLGCHSCAPASDGIARDSRPPGATRLANVETVVEEGRKKAVPYHNCRSMSK
ncbi:hypothetical protein K438DRAFT_596325 [Mycena galopus ATCC 62051]|nr:hypothetical protein K438DRAFT_596325 [Mycena galopus ATCC 62051]